MQLVLEDLLLRCGRGDEVSPSSLLRNTIRIATGLNEGLSMTSRPTIDMINQERLKSKYRADLMQGCILT